MKYQGGCHCGGIKFEVDGELKGVMACNCSICTQRGSLLWFVPRENFHWMTPERAASSYTFNKHKIKHRFCPNCGIHTHGEASDPSGKLMAAVNARCLEGVDIAKLPVKHFDGRSL